MGKCWANDTPPTPVVSIISRPSSARRATLRQQPLYERTLAINKEVLGERHPAYAASLKTCVAPPSAGDLAAAKPLFERAIAIKEVLGERHPTMPMPSRTWCILLGAKGDLAAAIPLANQTLDLAERLSGRDAPRPTRESKSLT